MRRTIRRIFISSLLALASSPALAKVSADEAAKLGTELTPVGATKAGNADGSIGEWTNGSMFPAFSRKLSPQDLEDARQEFEKVRAADPAPFNKLLGYVDNFSIEQYQEISDQVDAIIEKLPEEQKKLAKQAREEAGGSDKPKLIITKANLAEHADKVTDGHKALFDK